MSPSASKKSASKKPTVPLVPTERDVEIIRAVHTHRLLRSKDHLLPLFGGSANILRRLQALTRGRYLARLKTRAHEQAIYALGKEGAKLLRSRFGVPMPSASNWGERYKRLTERHVEHTLLIADVLIGVELACRAEEGLRYVPAAEVIESHASERVKRDAKRVGGRPLKWPVSIRSGKWQGDFNIEPDGLFGIEETASGETSWYFLEADRATMRVKPSRPQLDQASLFKKMLQYWASWQKDGGGSNLTSRHFGLSDVRTLFVLATQARGLIRLERCLEANRYFYDGTGTGLFLFAKREQLLEAPSILDAELISGKGQKRTLRP